MPLDNQLFSIIPSIQNWAEQKAFVQRLWLFGSRVRGTQRLDSDLDIALEIAPIGNDESALTTWISESSSWKSELQEISPFKIDLQFFGPSAPHIVQYVNCCSVLVYERAT